ncbi:exodeoxyribonuclease VII large subunit [Dechloromonas sp. TW-R-39-2]|uniref:exodeoxyribonuclease VII large subunit n=1 Tax=Dechloromonas sp. TW-R-39-2 TaxID=2654218 RepID=UPI00193D5EE6|nr:exodeoxyribonuclease VII large subunit [Dechloromonas sp. TW-R-39-2]QRM19012.1 exodeoxyribonuclease VII large subunit [Dechloromonas sp. TW-R-39-2]
MQNIASPVNNSVLTVAGLNRLVRECLETAFPLTWIGGEISNLTYAASGHVYFSLKDASAQVRCVMWRSRAQLLGWRLENGQKIEARALVSFYEPRGEFQLNIEAIRRAGQGDLFERFLRLKAQLENEGLFAVDRKKPLPSFPRHLAIVTSPQAAALRDVLSTLRRRSPHIRLTLFPTPVQGEGAGEKIAAALNAASASDCEAIILCRGGGSIEDLWAFNEECVARAIAAAPIPVVSGVGHETDFTIADFAADLRAPTPTAAAELLGPDREALRLSLARLQQQLVRQIERNQAERQQQLDWLATRLIHPAERLRQRHSDVSQLGLRLHHAMAHQNQSAHMHQANLRQRLHAARPQPSAQRENIAHLAYRLHSQANWQISRQTGKLNSLASSLKQLDPHAVLARGYALAIGADGKAIRDAGTLASGASLNISFARGSASVTVKQVVATPEAD